MSAVTPTLVFLPGLGADHRLFKYQTATFPNSYAADWIMPLPRESLEQYAVRFAEAIRVELDKRPPAPVVVCGLSLGGMIAPYVAQHLQAVGCILLCSIRCPQEFPRRYYLDWQLMRCCQPLRVIRVRMLRLGIKCFLSFPVLLRLFVVPEEFEIIRQMTEMPPPLFAGLARMMFDWAYRRREETDMPVFEVPVLQIHGTRDPLLPIRRTHPDIRISGGGHSLPVTHTEQINEMIAQFIAGKG
ncbi:MAG: alpha/beta hydrolase [Planctomycetaceae bacterium]|jgi:pimeloyl-ACP methyl ester carboxylesterase|nr:alpha/beta hydrolase [Planctomycetaceae bacterium]